MIIAVIAVLLAALGIGVGIKEIRERRAHSEVETAAKPEVRQTERAALPGGGVRPRSSGLTIEEREGQRESREDMRARWENMSDEEKGEYMAQRPGPGGPDGGRQGQRRRQPMLSEEERAEMEQMRARWDTMTEEEKAEAREQMRARFGGRGPGMGGRPEGAGDGRRGGGGDRMGSPELSPEERDRRRAEGERRMREEREPIPEN